MLLIQYICRCNFDTVTNDQSLWTQFCQAKTLQVDNCSEKSKATDPCSSGWL